MMMNIEEQIPQSCRGSRKSEHYICYVLRSSVVPARTYAGSTNDFVHRFRQHNGMIKGGARATETHRPWKICCLIFGFSSKSQALRYEYFTKVQHSKTWSFTRAQGKNSIERRAALLLTAELKMKIAERKRLSYYIPDDYMAECLKRARMEGVPGTVEAAWYGTKSCVMNVSKDNNATEGARSQEGERMSEEKGEDGNGGIQKGDTEVRVSKGPQGALPETGNRHSAQFRP